MTRLTPPHLIETKRLLNEATHKWRDACAVYTFHGVSRQAKREADADMTFWGSKVAHYQSILDRPSLPDPAYIEQLRDKFSPEEMI